MAKRPPQTPDMLPIFDAAMLQNPPLVPRGGSFDAVAAQVLSRAYAPALAKLERMKPPRTLSTSNDTLQYLTGLCLLLQKQPKKAAEHLFPLNRPGSSFQQEVQWLLGMGFLLEGKTAAAKAALGVVSKNPAHPRSAAAGQVLGRLE